MKVLAKIAVFALTAIPVAAVAQRPVATRQRVSAVHDRSPRIRERVISVRSSR